MPPSASGIRVWHPPNVPVPPWQFRYRRKSADASAYQVELSRQAIVSIERPFVVLKTIEWKPFGTKEPNEITYWKFIPHWENCGNTPTKRMTNYINRGYYPATMEDRLDFSDAGDGLPGRAMIGPKGIMHGNHRDIPVDLLARAKAGQGSVFIWGWADYDDVFESTPRHRTEFCFQIIITGDPVSEKCQFFFKQHRPFNGLDDECLRKPKPYDPLGAFAT